jgi:signal transduction histidine kinase/CheY-like chemotaxis protein
MKSIFVISTQSSDADTLTKLLVSSDYQVLSPVFQEAAELWVMIQQSMPSLVCVRVDDATGWNDSIARAIADQFPIVPLVLLCSVRQRSFALNALAQYAWDFIEMDEVGAGMLIKTLESSIKRVNQYSKLQETALEVAEAKAYSNRLLARMSQEIRTPMNAVIGMAEMLLDTELNSKQRYYTQTIHESGSLLVALFNDLLDYSKIEAGTIRIHDKPFNLHDSMRESISSTLASALEKRLEILVRIQPELPELFMGDDLRIRQIVMNLLDNAIKFTAQGFVKLDVGFVEEQGQKDLVIAVSDSGPGIRKDLLPILFKPYVQAAELVGGQKKGVGLGLAICDHLVRRMHGSIHVDSEVGKGSVFTVKFPFRPIQTQPEQPLYEALLGKKVLYVTSDNLHTPVLDEYLSSKGMLLDVKYLQQEYPEFGNQLQQYDLLITQIRTNQKFDLKLVDMVREKHAMPHILIKEREKVNEKIVVIRKDTVIMLKPIEQKELWEICEAVLQEKADQLNTVDRSMALDERMGEYHPLDILVAEDNAINQRIIMTVLSRHGYQVKMAENGKEALESLARRIYDVVLMDINMPVMDGITATKQIRKQLAPDRQPFIIALTADVLQQSKTDYLEQGMDEVLYKPVQTKALMQILAKCRRLDRLHSSHR